MMYNDPILILRFINLINSIKFSISKTLFLPMIFLAKYTYQSAGLAALVQLYVEAINTPGVIPNVQTAWDTFVVTKCSEALQTALNVYDSVMKSALSGQLPCDNDKIRQHHDVALEKGVAQLEGETFGISAVTTEKYLRELTVR